MVHRGEAINLGSDDARDKPIIINAESGSQVEINIDVKHYGYPEWLDATVRDKILSLLDASINKK